MRNVVYLSDDRERNKATGNDAFALPRLELEMAMELNGSETRPWSEIVRDAATVAGGELLFVLPGPDMESGIRQRAMVRLVEDGHDCLMFVCQLDNGYAIIDEDRIDPELAEFAQTTIRVMQHLSADANVIGPLAESLH
jgi:hypothetical protein